VLNDTADLKESTLTHNGKDEPVDLFAMLRQGDMSGNIKLLRAIESWCLSCTTYLRFGDVRTPGFYMYKPKDRMLDALNGVGGPNSDADLDKVNLIRIDTLRMRLRSIE